MSKPSGRNSFFSHMWKRIKDVFLVLRSKAIVKCCKWLSHLNRYLLQYSYNIEETDYESLTATSNASNNNAYEGPLLWALKKKDVLNIAVTGPYGAGKSSVIATFQHKFRQFKYINLSLATFEEGFKEKGKKNAEDRSDAWRSEVELSILQQLLYHVKNGKLPASRFQKIKHTSKAELWAVTVLFMIVLTAFCIVFNATLKEKITLWNKLEADWQETIVNIATGCLLATVSLLFALFYRSIKNLRLNKIGLTKGEVELDNKQEQSVFNKHLDEIMYFFRVTRYNVIIIEDLDRFDDAEIFTKLREVNNLINNSLQIRRRVKFVYAVKDDMFKDKERAKFFDFIIPVIPVVSTANAWDQLSKKLPSEINDKVPVSLRNVITLYIQDMRLLLNTMNEFRIYFNQIGKKLEPAKLLAVIIYKNLYPDDFATIHSGQGAVAAAFRSKETYVIERIKKYEEEILAIKEEIEKTEANHLLQEIELQSVYMVAVLKRLPAGATLKGGNSEALSIAQMLDEKHFDELYRNEAIRYLNSYGGTKKLDSKFSDIEQEINKESSYDERLKYIRKRAEGDVNALRRKLQHVEDKKKNIALQSLSDIIKINDGFVFPELVEQRLLLKYLLSNSYIDELYPTYISFFVEGSLVLGDMDFVHAVTQNNPLPFEHELKNCETLAGKYFTLSNYSSPAILNFHFLDWLLSDSSKATEAEMVLSQLTDKASYAYGFIKEYLLKSGKVAILIKLLDESEMNILNFLCKDASVTYELMEAYLMLFMKHLPVERLVAMEVSGNVRRFWEEHRNLALLFRNAGLLDKGMEMIAGLGLQLKHISELREDDRFFNFIVEQRLYALNIDNVGCVYFYFQKDKDITGSTFYNSNLSVIRENGAGVLLEYIESDIENYIREVFLKLPDNKSEEERVIIELLENKQLSKELKIAIVDSQQIPVKQINEVTEDALAGYILTLQNEHISWYAIFSYNRRVKNVDDNILTVLTASYWRSRLNKEEWHSLAEKYDMAAVLFEIDMLSANAIDDSAYTILAKLFHHKHSGVLITELSEKKLDALVEYERITLTPDYCIFLTKHYPALAARYILKNEHAFMALPEDGRLLKGVLFQELFKIRLTEKTAMAFLTLLSTNIDVLDSDLAGTLAKVLLPMKPVYLLLGEPFFDRLIRESMTVNAVHLIIGAQTLFSDTVLCELIKTTGPVFAKLVDFTQRQNFKFPASKELEDCIELLSVRFPENIEKFIRLKKSNEVRVIIKPS